MIKGKNVKGLIWSFTDNFLQQIVNFVIGIVLSRLLLPEEFGVLGIISVFIAFANTFVNSGLSDALINKKDAIDIDYYTVFWANVGLGLFTFVILFTIAPFAALFFGLPSLTFLIRFSAVSIVIVSLASIQRTILTKSVDFKKITIVSIIAVVTSGVVAVVMALNNYGVVSLVVRMVLGQVLTLILFWLINSWRPKLQFDVSSFKQMYKFGSKLFMSRLLTSIYDNLYYLVIGKFFSHKNLGYYTRAESFRNLATINITSSVQRVSFSILSSKQGTPEQIVVFKKFLTGTFFITSLFITILFGNANEIILILIGDKWLPSVEYLKILSISGLFVPLYFINLNLLAANGNTSLYFKLELFTKFFSIPTIIIGLGFGILPMLYAMIFSSLTAYVVSVIAVNKLFGFSYKQQISLIARGITLFIISIGLVAVFNYVLPVQNIYFKAIRNILLIFLTFGASLMYVFPDLLHEIKNIKRNQK